MGETHQLAPVRKHVGAIHIKNDISCLQRKAWNVLLHNAYEELPNPMVMMHRIRVKDLMELIGFNSKNVNYLKDALENMVTTKLTWNIIDERGKKEWGVSAALASAVISDGWCSYAYSPHLRAKLYNPEIYGLIDLDIQRKFSGSHALTLYENIARFRNIFQTPVFSLGLFCDLMGISENTSYLDFKILNRAVIKPAIKEINTVSDINITDVETLREKRKVVGVKFNIAERVQSTLAIEATETFNQELLTRLQEYFCLTEKQAKDALVIHSEDRIKSAMQYTEERYLAGKIRKGKITPYFLKILKEGEIAVGESAYDRAKRSAEERTQSKRDQAAEIAQRSDEYKQIRVDKVRLYIDELTDETNQALFVEFDGYIQGQGRMISSHWKKSGLEHKLVQAAFATFIEQKILPPFEEGLAEFLKNSDHP
jgi:plasmid replication initiation protein